MPAKAKEAKTVEAATYMPGSGFAISTIDPSVFVSLGVQDIQDSKVTYMAKDCTFLGGSSGGYIQGSPPPGEDRPNSQMEAMEMGLDYGNGFEFIPVKVEENESIAFKSSMLGCKFTTIWFVAMNPGTKTTRGTTKPGSIPTDQVLSLMVKTQSADRFLQWYKTGREYVDYQAQQAERDKLNRLNFDAQQKVTEYVRSGKLKKDENPAELFTKFKAELAADRNIDATETTADTSSGPVFVATITSKNNKNDGSLYYVIEWKRRPIKSLADASTAEEKAIATREEAISQIAELIRQNNHELRSSKREVGLDIHQSLIEKAAQAQEAADAPPPQAPSTAPAAPVAPPVTTVPAPVPVAAGATPPGLEDASKGNPPLFDDIPF